MNEEQFQIGIRDLSKHDLIKLINIYRDELVTSWKIFKDFAENNFAQSVWHKVVTARKLSRIEVMTEDYNIALKEELKCQ